MRRLGALILLVAFSLPFARAPLCQAGSHEHTGSHEHAEHHEHVMYDAAAESITSSPDERSCHDLMQCQVSSDVAPVDLSLVTQVVDFPRSDGSWASSRLIGEPHAPLVPPPQAI